MTLAFSLIDYGVFFSMLAVSTVIGVYFAYKDRKNISTEQFLLGNRKLSIFPVAMSILASFTSVIILIFFKKST
jgi:solute carrier family 5 (sodium-coupled monocarboxylate transporter), member 8/12